MASFRSMRVLAWMSAPFTWSTPCRAVLAILAVATIAGAAPASAQIPSVGVDDFKMPPDAAWHLRTEDDVEAAYRFIKENHPGAAPELRDSAFVTRLDAAHATATSRARSVTSLPGYLAVLAGFATDLGDKHIWSRPTFVLNLPYWTGAMIGKQGENWVVVVSDEAPGSPPQGARLVSCDGIAASDLARRNLGGFKATWRIEAQQYQAAPWLLVDEGNPFIKRPSTCIFETAHGNNEMSLHWKRIKREELLPKLRAAGGGGAAGYGVRKVGQGYWVALQDLTEKGAGVATEVEAKKADIRGAPFVVVDVRGNGGGTSTIATRIAKVLWGDDRVHAVQGDDDDDSTCGDDFRTSPGNLADMAYLIETIGPIMGPEVVADLQKQIASGKDAAAHGRSFARPPVCVKKTSPAMASAQIRAATGPKVILLTDNLCFSSCLVLTDLFRTLGALHVGQTTDAATRYTDVREQYLPSGYSLFSTLQAVAPGEPADNGPFRPERIYQGNIADTPAVERWVLAQVNGAGS